MDYNPNWQWVAREWRFSSLEAQDEMRCISLWLGFYGFESEPLRFQSVRGMKKDDRNEMYEALPAEKSKAYVVR